MACSEQQQSTSLAFKLNFQKQALDCRTEFIYQQQNWQLTQLQLYISQVELQNRQGEWHPWPMQENAYQHDNVALIGEHCGDSGYWQIEFNKPQLVADVTNIRFQLGIPFTQNHQNPLSQASPLNVPSMFWIWQTGHKFMRLELTAGTQDWLFHLGSTGCQAPSPVRAPNQPCLQPNLFQISLPVAGALDSINIDLAALIHDIALSNNNSCQSEPDHASCRQLFHNLTANQGAKLFSFAPPTSIAEEKN